MGELNQHNLSAYIQKYGCSYFIETGTGIGTGLSFAIKHRFAEFISIEINRELFERAKSKFLEHKHVMILNESSIDGLNTAIDSLPDNDRILFWLDAHFPGADFQLGSYDDVHEDYIKYPLN